MLIWPKCIFIAACGLVTATFEWTLGKIHEDSELFPAIQKNGVSAGKKRNAFDIHNNTVPTEGDYIQDLLLAHAFGEGGFSFALTKVEAHSEGACVPGTHLFIISRSEMLSVKERSVIQ